MQLLKLILPVKFTVTKSLKFPTSGREPLIPHMAVCTVKVHKLTEFDIVKPVQFTEVLSVVLGHCPQFSDRIL